MQKLYDPASGCFQSVSRDILVGVRVDKLFPRGVDKTLEKLVAFVTSCVGLVIFYD